MQTQDILFNYISYLQIKRYDLYSIFLFNHYKFVLSVFNYL